MKARFARLASLLLVVVVGGAVGWSAPARSQEPAKRPQIKGTVAPATPIDSGAAMFNAYCAACHGVRGEGDGPAAKALKQAPPNLRTLAQRNNGTFPSAQVQAVLKFGVSYPAHGSSDMPVWGPTFRALDADSGTVMLRIANLTEHVKSLQLP
jgi:mono/diheme cytochrome c family protein